MSAAITPARTKKKPDLSLVASSCHACFRSTRDTSVLFFFSPLSAFSKGRRFSLMSKLFFYYSYFWAHAHVLMFSSLNSLKFKPPPTQKTSLESCWGGKGALSSVARHAFRFVFLFWWRHNTFFKLWPAPFACSQWSCYPETPFSWKTCSLMLSRSYMRPGDYYGWVHIVEKAPRHAWRLKKCDGVLL